LDGQARAASVVRAAPAAAPALTPYLDPMPLLVDNAIIATGPGATVDLTTAVIHRQLHSQLPTQTPTTLFGYLQGNGPGAEDTGTSFLGPAIVAKSGVPVTVNYHNGLLPGDHLRVFTNNGSSYLQFNGNYGGVRIQTHLHGSIDSGLDDGNPFANPTAFESGATQTVTYPNHQPATLLWYHDHLLGDTRMNVVAGLAGGYLLRDADDGFDTGHNPQLPGPLGEYELPIVLQDRQLNADGSLLYPVAPTSTNGPWIGEYFGTLMLVNGRVWPFLEIEPALYRFRVLNGCNARILNLSISQPNASKSIPMTIVGAEGGLLPLKPTAANRLVMAPAERFDVICDFRQFAGQTLIMANNNLPSGVVSSPGPTLKTVMQFRVTKPLSGGAPTTIPTTLPLNQAVDTLTAMGAPKLSGGTNPDVGTRMITLNEIGAGTTSWRLNLNASPYGDTTAAQQLHWGKVEDWYFVNLTPDTHPMHTHLFTFRVMGRYNFDAKGFVAASNPGPNGVGQVNQQDVSPLAPFLKSKLMAPPPEETGLKETVKVNPGQVTVVRAMFTPPPGLGNTTQMYVHHCHIVEHEDNDMMERVIVSP
jgi:FtsP/CotA-like multicopper oxidase with cupredoxin domain